jgi:hypothetical protein
VAIRRALPPFPAAQLRQIALLEVTVRWVREQRPGRKDRNRSRKKAQQHD